MRTLSVILILAGLLSACGQREKELEQKVADLQTVAAQKDSAVSDFLTSLTNIRTNLDSIKTLEGIVSTRAASGSEQNSDMENDIIDNMKLIYSSMRETRDQLDKMEKKLEQSAISSEKLKRFIADLKQQIKAKDNEIIGLKQGLAKANIYIDKLMASVDELALENERRIKVVQQKNIDLQRKEDEIQTAYWAVGTTKALREKNIIDKEGSFLGMGGVKVVSEEMNLADLEKINIQEVKEININAKKAELVTSHPKDTYEFVSKDKKIQKIVIVDPDMFWQNSKVMVIVTN